MGLRLTVAAAAALLAAGCAHAGGTPEDPMSTETTTTLRRGRAVYRTELLPVAPPPAVSGFSPELTLAIMRGNVSPERVVTFDGDRTRVDETTVELGWRSPATRIVVGGDETYCKTLPLLQLCVRAPVVEDPLETGVEAPLVTPLAGERVIAGRRCGEALVEDEAGRWRIWYDASVSVETPAPLLRVAGIEGLVCEREALDAPPGAVARRRDTLVELTTEVAPGAFAPPPGFEPATSTEAAIALSRARIEAVPPGIAPEALIGRWRLLSPGADDVVLDVAREGEAFMLARTDGGGGPAKRAPARIHGGWLVADGGRVPELYALDGGGRLVHMNRGVFRYERDAVGP